MSTANIMIVEDNTTVAQDCHDCLIDLGYNVTSIQASGEESILMAETQMPDAVLMDIHLRDKMDGITAAEHIYNQFQIPVVFLSAYGDHELLQRAKKVGSFGYLIKPFEERELCATLEMALYKARADKEQKKMEAQINLLKKMESIGTLAGGIAHDFNNLLGGILGNIELAMLKTTEEEVSTYLARSLSNIDRTRALTQQLLTFSTGGAPIKKVENLFPFIQETTQFALSGSSISSRFQIEEDLYPCDFDKNQIGQVVEKLILNARQAMADGGLIEVSACNLSLSAKEHQPLAAGNYVKISIQDHGTGISKDSLPNIFDPYYTTDSNGQGLGLSICYSIINSHGGYIEVESELGKGSTFSVYLPASTESILTIPVDQTERDACEHVGTGTFLVMDDEEIIRLSMGGILENFGYRVVLKENGKDAIDFFKEETKAHRKLAGMIFDLTIPGGMGGIEAIREIRKICSDTPAFVASGYSADPVMAYPEEYGFNSSICKPFKMSELSEMLEKYMRKLK